MYSFKKERKKDKLKDWHFLRERMAFSHLDVETFSVPLDSLENDLELFLSLLKNVGVLIAFAMERVDFETKRMVFLRFR